MHLPLFSLWNLKKRKKCYLLQFFWIALCCTTLGDKQACLLYSFFFLSSKKFYFSFWRKVLSSKSVNNFNLISTFFYLKHTYYNKGPNLFNYFTMSILHVLTFVFHTSIYILTMTFITHMKAFWYGMKNNILETVPFLWQMVR